MFPSYNMPQSLSPQGFPFIFEIIIRVPSCQVTRAENWKKTGSIVNENE